MNASTKPDPTPCVPLPVTVVSDVQDALVTVMTDLQRLQGLLNQATSTLMDRFDACSLALGNLKEDGSSDVSAARHILGQAVIELQFHDLATQLLTHTSNQLQGCAHRLADQAMGPDDDELSIERFTVSDRPSPVAQSEWQAGSVELF